MCVETAFVQESSGIGNLLTVYKHMLMCMYMGILEAQNQFAQQPVGRQKWESNFRSQSEVDLKILASNIRRLHFFFV